MALTPEQMVAMAIEADCMRVNMYWDGAMPFPVARQVLKFARARLEGKP